MVQRKVTAIPATIKKYTAAPIDNTAKRRVAAYARVSTDHEEQLSSYEAQVDYYTNYIKGRNDWEFAGIYTDEGISATNTRRREGFKRMVADALDGKIDLIVTKSVSRFARNTVDSLTTIRQLKDNGVEVYFEKENIRTMDAKGELLITIMSSLAQEESRSISENVKWGTVKRFQQGIPNGRFRIYGYRWDGDHLVIEPEEAKIVRLIYDNFLQGMSAEETEAQLEGMNVKSFKGQHFSNASIRNILNNITYTGNLLLQKHYTVDPLNKKIRTNHGELPQYWVEDTHEPIIDMETYRRVQDEMSRRRELGALANPHIPTSCFTGKIQCAQCGMSYRRHTNKRKDDNYVDWMCSGKDSKGREFCGSKDVPEEILIRSCCAVLGLDEFSEDIFLERVESITVCTNNLLIFHMMDGAEIPHTWEFNSTAKADWWTPERRRAWSDYLSRKETNPAQSHHQEFSGFIRCGCCGANYRSQGRTLSDGTRRRYWYCKTPHSQCSSFSIKDETMKGLVADVLGLDEFDEGEMDAAMDYATILDHTVTFHFRDGHTEVREYVDKRVGTSRPQEMSEDGRQ